MYSFTSSKRKIILPLQATICMYIYHTHTYHMYVYISYTYVSAQECMAMLLVASEEKSSCLYLTPNATRNVQPWFLLCSVVYRLVLIVKEQVHIKWLWLFRSVLVHTCTCTPAFFHMWQYILMRIDLVCTWCTPTYRLMYMHTYIHGTALYLPLAMALATSLRRLACMYVCMYVRMYVYIYIYIYMHVCMHVRMYVWLCSQGLHVELNAHMRSYGRMDTYSQERYPHAWIFACMHTHIRKKGIPMHEIRTDENSYSYE